MFEEVGADHGPRTSSEEHDVDLVMRFANDDEATLAKDLMRHMLPAPWNVSTRA